jgi:hypothetical protein
MKSAEIWKLKCAALRRPVKHRFRRLQLPQEIGGCKQGKTPLFLEAAHATPSFSKQSIALQAPRCRNQMAV